MALNSDSYRRLREARHHNLHSLRTRLRRAEDGKILGVLKGIADSMGWSVRVTRFVGVVALLVLVSIVGVHGFISKLLACGFFYLLASLLMGPPRTEALAGDTSAPPLRPSAAAPYPSMGRVDLATLDRQLESLNRRIRRMESVVTDPAYDWERRLGK